MNTVQLECFVAVAENLNFARAAEQLHVTQPAVTHQINSLENELEAKLFRRTTRSVELTPAGFGFLNDARDILVRSESAKARISSRLGSQILPFHIGCGNILEYNLLSDPLRRLREEYPNLHPVLKQFQFHILHSQLEEESTHVMFGIRPEQTKKRTGAFTLLANAPVVCVLTPSHPLAGKNQLSISELEEGPIVTMDPRQISTAFTPNIGAMLTARAFSDIYISDSIPSTLALIRAGFGFALLPDIPLLRVADLLYIPVEGFPPTSFGLFYKDLSTHPALKRFIQLMQETFAAYLV